MPQLPFDIPKSLASYAEHFEDDPIKATTRLKKQLKKRGPDAVGHFLLAWFYHLKGMDEQAVDEALKARIFAPGSPFFQKLHYYLSHPKAFEAWTPERDASTQSRHTTSLNNDAGPVLDLDSLIERLSGVESKRIQPEKPLETDETDENRSSDNVDDIVSETLAKIHEKQGKIDAAIQTYERLKKIKKENEQHYSDEIARLNKLKEEKDDEE